MKRRAFFDSAFRSLTRAAVQGAEPRAERKASRWIRPPFAKPELTFLLACSRCDKCIEVCRPGVLFRLSPRLGPEVTATPAMDLANKGCQMCDGWPCVTVCEPRALAFPAAVETGQSPPTPLMARVQIDPQHCLPYAGPECGACGSACPIPGALQWTGPRPQVNEQLCSGCALCREVCPTQPKAVRVKPLLPPVNKENESETL